MNKYKFVVAALVLSAAFSPFAKAQSPWESGTFKGYDQASPTNPVAPSGTTGLQGFSLAPSTQDAAPAAPYIVPTPQPQLAPSYQQPEATMPQATAGTPSSSSTPPLMTGAVADSTFILLSQKSVANLVESSKLAQKNATSDMQGFADQIVSIYTGMQNDLAGLAQKNNISTVSNFKLPNTVDKLKNLSGADFNKEYMKSQMSDFYMLDSTFKNEAQSGQNEALKSYAANHLAMIDEQKAMVLKSYMSTTGQNSSSGPFR